MMSLSNTKRNLLVWILLVIGQVSLLFPEPLNCSTGSSPQKIVTCTQKELTIQAEKTPLEQIIQQIHSACELDILGLDHRYKELVTFSASGDTEDVIKRLLKHLGEKNSAFEYSRVKLSKVKVMPEGKTIASHIPVQPPPQEPQPPPEPPKEPPSAQAVRVFKVLEGTQAMALGLQEGDLILEYDGLRITDTQQLMEEVKKKSDMGSVEMVVVRNGEILRYHLAGGKIGIQIGTGMVPPEVMEQYAR